MKAFQFFGRLFFIPQNTALSSKTILGHAMHKTGKSVAKASN